MNGEYINMFISGLGKVNFWNRKRDTNLVSDHGCHIGFGFYGLPRSAPCLRLLNIVNTDADIVNFQGGALIRERHLLRKSYFWRGAY